MTDIGYVQLPRANSLSYPIEKAESLSLVLPNLYLTTYELSIPTRPLGGAATIRTELDLLFPVDLNCASPSLRLNHQVLTETSVYLLTPDQPFGRATSTMAPSNDTGEHATPLPKSELEVDSSSHMHELHFPPAGKACASDSASRSPSTLVGQENARLTSMPPLVVPVRSSSLVRSSPSKKNRRSLRKAAHVRDKLSIDSTSGGDNTIVLRIIDLNVVAASALPKDVDVTKRPPNDRQESAHEYGGLGQVSSSCVGRLSGLEGYGRLTV